MSDQINVLQRVDNVEIAPLFNTYSRVVINVDDETQASAGTTTTGRTLELDNPLFGSAAVANKILSRLQGYQYQPFYADGALLDPAAEMGDGITANDVYGGIYTRDRHFGRLMKSDVSAPHDEEINHEYQFETPTERRITREMGNVRATFAIQSGEINARVTKTGSNSSSTFAWSLDSDGFFIHNAAITSSVKQNKSALFSFTNTGLSVKGKITATSGYIGNESNGFEITSTAIRNGMESLNDTQHNGIYIGTNGIALAKGAFKVTSSGSIIANNITLTGTLNVGGSNISASTLRQGAQEGYNWGSGGGGYGGYSSKGAYALGGAQAGFSAQTDLQKFLNGQTVLGNLTVSGVMRINNRLDLWGMGAGYDSVSVLTGITVDRQWVADLGMYVVNNVRYNSTTLSHLQVR